MQNEFQAMRLNRRVRIKTILVIALSLGLYFAVSRSSMIVTRDKEARESVLKSDLSTMRTAIDDYTFQEHRPPQSLQDLVNQGYLREIPTDPITTKKDWVTHSGKVEVGPDLRRVGVDDVHSAYESRGRNGSPYDTW